MIKQTYDREADALYIELSGGEFGRTDEIDSGTLVDLDTDGGVLGIEVIHPMGRRWPWEDIIRRYPFRDGELSELMRISGD